MVSVDQIKVINSVEIRTAIVKLRSDGIMQYNLKHIPDFNKKDLVELNNVVGIISKGKSYPNLIFIDQFINPDAECREYAASEDSLRYTTADAFIIKSTPLKIIANFYIKVNKPVRPTRIFVSESEALNWLYTFL